LDLPAGQQLSILDEAAAEDVTAVYNQLARQEAFWVKRLSNLTAAELSYADRSNQQGGKLAAAPMAIPAAVPEFLAEQEAWSQADFLTAAFAAYLARFSGSEMFHLGLQRSAETTTPHLFATAVPMQIAVDGQMTATAVLDKLQTELTNIADKHKTYALDTVLRFPELAELKGQANIYPIAVQQAELLDETADTVGSELTLVVAENGAACRWMYDTAVYNADAIQAMQQQFTIFLQNLVAADADPLAQIAILSEAEQHKLLVDWNETAVSYNKNACVHTLIETQAQKTPDAIAVVFEDQQISYRQLNRRANQMARYLSHLGVGPDKIVGVYMDRSIEMMVGLIGIHKAGGAYLPLDPNYPADRIAYMVEDSDTAVILTQDHLVSKMPPNSAQMVKVDADWDTISEQNHENVVSDVKPSNLSYLIYTSGSTGKPKGVMVEHGNVVNFFAGMDQQIPHDEPGTWLAVTSLSFDISVLELFWTLAHGFKLVVFADKTRGQEAIALPASPHADKHIGFSLFFFSSDESEQGVEHKYDFLMKGVKFADQHGFEAVWTPERHFHAFGGLYPSPTVISAAIAVMTKNVRIRTGSYVSPLHSPIRAAEEWAVVDNLSNGRVDLGIAAGWQPNDFVLRPGNYPDRKEIMFRDIETVRKLWRGESIKVMNDLGKEIEVQTLPHPVQKELPVWITAASNPDTFKMAGERGFNVLTHLLGQSIEELAGKIDIYRQAWRDNGHEGEGHMSIMLHTFVSDDVEEAREISRAPLSNYLASAVSLVQKAAWHFPTFREKAKATGKSPFEMFDSDLLTAEDVEAVLDFAFERYFETSGIFGNPQKALKIVNQLKGVGVDEIGCLVDFGVPSSVVLDNLKYINELKEMATPKQGSDDFSIAAQINRHNVTHFQCTPSMARMLLMDEANKAALSKVQTVMIGGEAFSASLAAELQALVQGDVINMYGPTETTIWSSTYELNGMETAVSIGKPIANTQIYILDGQMQPVPVGVAGDLYIGGDGVVRGYHRRPELTAERFIQFNNQRVYKTGDLARYRSCGNIDFLGRADFQVKMRGYRIEMGEIEALLNEHPAVRDAVVVAREDVPSDLRLVAYLIPHDGQKVTNRELRGALKQQLPEFMVPAHFVTMDAFPLTPNKKTDRKALPAPDQMQMQTEVAYAPPTNELGESIAEIWRGLLNVQQIGINDNFFDIGGHSLFAVQAHRQIQQITEKKLSITDIFRFPTIRSLVAHLSQDSN
ncbi:MAG: LLM class flavin-dependent oxidoreductase, partial [Chloroflexi bacterium]|nr:LLM class flavin-dependent oxidoreductase [Chloroflexota bacterium]